MVVQIKALKWYQNICSECKQNVTEVQSKRAQLCTLDLHGQTWLSSLYLSNIVCKVVHIG